MYKFVVFSVFVAVIAAKPNGHGFASLAALGGLPLGSHFGLATAAAPIIAHASPAVAVAGHWPNYRGPLSLAPGQPANIVAHDGRPLDTLSVNVDRAIHYTARAFDHAHGAHSLGKRSASLIAPVAWSHTARIDLPAAHGFGVPAVAHAAWRAPISPLAYGHLSAWGHAGVLSHH